MGAPGTRRMIIAEFFDKIMSRIVGFSRRSKVRETQWALGLLVVFLCSGCGLNIQAEQATATKRGAEQGVAVTERPNVSAPTPAPAASKKDGEIKGTQPGSAKEDIPRCLQIAKAIAETLALVLAFLFFLFKTYVGYLTSNLSLTVDCKRYAAAAQPGQKATDYLAVTASVKKGENGLLRLFLAEARVAGVGTNWNEKKPFDIKRIGYNRTRVLERKGNAIAWDEENKCFPLLQLPPGDGTHFACCFEVPSTNVYLVDVVIMGRGKFPKLMLSQWRASRVSIPGEKESKPAKEGP